jgi:glucose-6-phosphate isomerase
MSYRYDMRSSLRCKGLSEEALAPHLQRMPAIFDGLKKQAEQGEIAMLTEPYKQDDLAMITRWGKHISEHFRHLVVIGTGGSSLGGQMLTAITSPRFVQGALSIHYADNTDPDTMEQLLSQLPLKQSFFLVVSKSGNTVETIAQFLLILQALQDQNIPAAEHCLAISMPGDRPLRQLAEARDIAVEAHDPAMGGRFSVLSCVGLIPAAAAGLDVAALRQGAAGVMDSCWKEGAASAPAAGAALQYQAMQAGYPISVLMPYSDRLAYLGNWYQQLWAESLGKHGQGSTPVKAVGAVDQHSQLQLYLDGPRDKLMTLICTQAEGAGPQIHKDLAKEAGMDYLGGHALGNIIAAQQHATRQTLINHQVPVRSFTINAVEEEAVGALLQHFMMETVLTAALMGVDAFNQPAVEESKQLARARLAG